MSGPQDSAAAGKAPDEGVSPPSSPSTAAADSTAAREPPSLPEDLRALIEAADFWAAQVRAQDLAFEDRRHARLPALIRQRSSRIKAVLAAVNRRDWRGDYEGALEKLEELRRVAPAYPRLERRIKDVERAKARALKRAETLLNRAHSAIASEDYDQADRLLAEAGQVQALRPRVAELSRELLDQIRSRYDEAVARADFDDAARLCEPLIARLPAAEKLLVGLEKRRARLAELEAAAIEQQTQGRLGPAQANFAAAAELCPNVPRLTEARDTLAKQLNDRRANAQGLLERLEKAVDSWKIEEARRLLAEAETFPELREEAPRIARYIESSEERIAELISSVDALRQAGLYEDALAALVRQGRGLPKAPVLAERRRCIEEEQRRSLGRSKYAKLALAVTAVMVLGILPLGAIHIRNSRRLGTAEGFVADGKAEEGLALLAKAGSFIAQGGHKRAIRDSIAAIAESYRSHGNAAMAKSRWSRAIRDFERAGRLELDCSAEIAEAKVMQTKLAEVVAIARRAIDAKRWHRAVAELNRARKLGGDVEEELDNARKASQLLAQSTIRATQALNKGDAIEARKQLSIVELLGGKATEERARLEKLERRRRIVERARAAEEQGQFRSALAALKKAWSLGADVGEQMERVKASLRSRALERLQSLEGWRKTPMTEQDEAVDAVGFALGSAFEHRVTQKAAGHGSSPRLALFRHRATGIDFALVPAGQLRPSLGEGVAPVTSTIVVTRPFLIAQHEISLGERDAGFGKGGPAEARARPGPWKVKSLDDIKAFLRAVGDGFRLPMESEWRFAAQGDIPAPVWWHGSARPRAWGSENARKPKPVSAHSNPLGENPFQLSDSLGNLWEWCLRSPLSAAAPVPETSTCRLRGGSIAQPLAQLSAALWRRPPSPEETTIQAGFRPAISLPPEKRH